MRFFALPDSNTSQRVTISVLGHVVVSQMDIVQVPYATVTGKYVRALSYGPYSYGLHSYGSCDRVVAVSTACIVMDLHSYGLHSYGLYICGL